MAKKVEGYIKLQIPAGKATPAPPVGPALGQHGVNIVEFTKQFNARTADQGILSSLLSSLFTMTEVSALSQRLRLQQFLLKSLQDSVRFRCTEQDKKVATITKAQVREIAEMKMPDLNAATVEAAESMIAGTCRSMGVVVED